MDVNMYINAPLVLEKICRACLMEKGDMKPLFGTCLDEMLMSFANIKVCTFYKHYAHTNLYSQLFFASGFNRRRFT